MRTQLNSTKISPFEIGKDTYYDYSVMDEVPDNESKALSIVE